MVARLRKAMALSKQQASAQDWLDRRFVGLRRHDFRAELMFVATSALEPPPGFEACWSCTSLPGPACRSVDAILIVVDISQPEQVHMARKSLEACDALGDDAPPVFLLPHSAGELACQHLCRDLLISGADAIIDGEAEGFALVLAVRSAIARTQAMVESMARLDHFRRLRKTTDDMLWVYLRMRYAPTLPPVDHSLASRGSKPVLEGFTFGDVLGSGSFGSVYFLHPTEGADVDAGIEETTPQVAKVIEKAKIGSLSDLRALEAQIRIMRHLSTDEFRHPNVVRLLGVYHAPAHVVFRLEFGGAQNLFRRLASRENARDSRAISTCQTGALIQQCCAAVHHLHALCRVAHRDVKPENIVVRERDGLLEVKLTDFDLAVSAERACRGSCGTLPFAAPELQVEQQYSATAADVWSLGVVVLEVLCGIRTIEHALGLGAQNVQRGMVGDVRALFSGAGGAAGASGAQSLAAERCRSECRPLLGAATHMLDGALEIDPASRWDAARILEAASALVSQDASPAGAAE